MPQKSAKFTPTVQIAAQNSSSPCYSNLRGQLPLLPRANMQVEAGIAHPGSTWTNGQACRDGIRKINAQVELKLKIPLELRNVKDSKGFTGTAATKGRPKTQ